MNNKKITMMLFLTALTTAGAYAQGMVWQVSTKPRRW